MEFLKDRPPGYEHLTAEMCLECKGAKGLCGMPCLLLSRIDNRLPQLKVTTQDIQGPSPPGLFVGRHGYPDVGFGPLLPPVDLPESTLKRMDDPAAWTRSSIEDVLGLRSTLLRTNRRTRITDARRPDRFLRVTQELAMASTAVDTEVHLTKRPNLELTARVGDTESPMGPTLAADRARLTENPHVASPVERIVGDTDVRAAVAIGELSDAGLQPHQIERLLAVGLLGQRNRRRLVPTRWSITATDDMIGRTLIDRVQGFTALDTVELYHGVTHGNRFHVLLVPQAWAFDMIETWIKGAMWALEDSPFIHDGEDWRGRTAYASNITGAYYAARLSVLRHLLDRRRQAGVFVYREITPDYWAPLGVWVIREAVRESLAKQARTFQTVDQALDAMRVETLRSGWDRASPFLMDLGRQRRITEYA